MTTGVKFERGKWYEGRKPKGPVVRLTLTESNLLYCAIDKYQRREMIKVLSFKFENGVFEFQGLPVGPLGPGEKSDYYVLFDVKPL